MYERLYPPNGICCSLAPTVSGIGLGHDKTSSAGLRRGVANVEGPGVEDGAAVVAGVVVSASAVVAVSVSIGGAVAGGVAAVDGALVDEVTDATSAGRPSASDEAAEDAALAVWVTPRTEICDRVSDAPGTIAMATAEASTKGRRTRTPLRLLTGTHQEQHNSCHTDKVRMVHIAQKVSSQPPDRGPINDP